MGHQIQRDRAGEEAVSGAEQVKALLTRFGLSPNPGLGQNFLTDGGKAEAIAQAACGDGSLPVLEIGPGLGALTGPLLARAPMVCAVELDEALAAALGALYGHDPKLCLVQGDFLKTGLDGLYTRLGGPFIVAANLPYYATTPICLKLLACGLPIERLALMAQAEAADRFFARPGARQYGPLAVLAQYYYAPTRLLSLSPADYYPQPEVSSAVTLLQSRHLGPLPGFPAFLQRAFAMRRKTLANNLKGMDGALDALSSLGIPPAARAESLEPAQLAALCAALERVGAAS